jgi:hypothetical protein
MDANSGRILISHREMKALDAGVKASTGCPA